MLPHFKTFWQIILEISEKKEFVRQLIIQLHKQTLLCNTYMIDISHYFQGKHAYYLVFPVFHYSVFFSSSSSSLSNVILKNAGSGLIIEANADTFETDSCLPSESKRLNSYKFL